FPHHKGESICCLAFSPDGRTLAAGSSGRFAMLYDWRRHCGLIQPARKLDEKEMGVLWEHLAAADTGRALQAVGTLAAAGAPILPLLRKRLLPENEPAPRPTREFIVDL